MAKYMQAYRLIENDGYHTGVGAQFETDKQTQTAFDTIPGVPPAEAAFYIDLCDDDGEDAIIDTAFISAETYKAVCQAPIFSDSEYKAIDLSYTAA